jgi:hypothetical protein
MNHYFDDVFTRHTSEHTSAPRQHLRRSSTARSIGARSDFDNTISGELDEEVKSVENSVDSNNTDRDKEKKEADVHTAHYVSEALSRVRSHGSVDFGAGDEFEAQLDEQ